MEHFRLTRAICCSILYNRGGGDTVRIAPNFGGFFKEKRRITGLTLREFCRTNGLDPGNISKIERGILAPPQSQEILAKYAAALSIKKGNDDWLMFHDLARTSAGKIPADIVSNERVMNALPVLFRTARKKTLDEKDLKNLLKSIKRELR
jgi:transcriptional regulator with XRE-family HTH domain